LGLGDLGKELIEVLAKAGLSRSIVCLVYDGLLDAIFLLGGARAGSKS
jgi:hypothetical protein